MKNVTVFLILLFVILSSSVFSQSRPDWVTNNGISSSYPESHYMTGFGIGESNDEAERISRAEQSARVHLSSKFLVTVKSDLMAVERESWGSFYSDYRSQISAQTSLDLIDVNVLHWDDVRREKAYGLAVLEIKPGIQNYSNRMTDLADDINDLLKSAESSEENGDVRRAVDYYRETFPLFLDREQARIILRLLKVKAGESSSLPADSLKVSAADIDVRVNRLLHENITSLQGAAVSLADQLDGQIELRLSLAIFPLKNVDTESYTKFSRYFQDVLESEFTPYFRVIARGADGRHMKQTRLVLTGTYRTEGGRIEIIATISDLASGAKRATATVSIPFDIFENEGF